MCQKVLQKKQHQRARRKIYFLDELSNVFVYVVKSVGDIGIKCPFQVELFVQRESSHLFLTVTELQTPCFEHHFGW